MRKQKNIIMNHIWRLILTLVLALAAASVTYLPVKAAINFAAAPAFPNTDTQVNLKWTPVTYANYYNIYRNNALIKSINTDTDINYTSYTDTGLVPETLYNYRVTAVRSDMSEIETASAAVTTGKMLKPNILSAIYDINTGSTTITWSNQSLAAGRSIIKKANGQVISAKDSADAYNTFSDTGAATGYSVQYTVTCMDTAGHSSPESAQVTVIPVQAPLITARMNQGSAAITWTPTAYSTYYGLQRSKYEGTYWGNWVEVNSQVSSGAGSATDTPDISGVYRYRLSAKQSYTGFSNDSEPVYKPGAPHDLACTITDSNRIDLSWANDPNNPCDLKVQRRVSYGNYVTIATLDKSASTYSDTTGFNTNNTYSYRITAYDTEYNQVSSKEYLISTSAPAAPSSLVLTVISDTHIDLSWADNSGNESAFKIERQTDSGSYTEINSTPLNSVSFSDTGVLPGHIYSYRVRAWNPGGYSSYTNTAAADTNQILAAPNSLDAAVVSPTQVNLTWTYPGSGSCSTVIERRSGTAGSWAIIANIPQGVFTYSDTQLTPNTQYFYRVSAVSGSYAHSGTYPNDNTGKSAYTLINKPSNLSGYVNSSMQVVLSWLDTSDEQTFVIERKTGTGSYIVAGSTNSNITAWVDTTVTPNAQYTYRVIAKSLNNQSIESDPFTITATYLEAPTNLVVTPVNDTSVQLAWNDNSSAESGYEIWRKAGSSSLWEKYAVTARNSRSFADLNTALNTVCYYKVRAFITPANTYSAYSAEAVSSITLLSAPENLAYTFGSDSAVLLTWTDNSSLESGYKVERKTGENSNWQEISSLPENSVSYTDRPDASGKNYEYRVKVYDLASYTSFYSNEIRVDFSKPQAPSDLELLALPDQRVQLEWTDNSENEEGFTIERKELGKAYTEIAKVGSDATRFVDENLKSGKKYYYRLRAFNNSGTSDYCTAESVTTLPVCSFTDLPDQHWAKEAVDYLYVRGILNGKTEDLFAPEDKISRAEFVCLVVRAFQLDRTPVGSFTDVSSGDWFYREVMIAKSLGIISGDSSNCFYPGKYITREDMAVIITKVLKAAGRPLPAHDLSALDEFTDVNEVSPYALSSLASLHGEGILEGKINQRIAPKATASRAEAAMILYKVMTEGD